MGSPLEALRSSVDRLAALVRTCDDAATRRAYPSEWTVADVLSHVGSGAEIFRGRLDTALADAPLPDGFGPNIWAAWDAKSPQSKIDDGIAADDALTTHCERLSPEERARANVPMGASTFEWERFVLGRLNEHLLHEWDVAVALDPEATLAGDGVVHVVDNLEGIARFIGRPVDEPGEIAIETTAPQRWFRVEVGNDDVQLLAAEPTEPTLTMPAESLVRLVYGRLDQSHTPSVVDEGPTLDRLRRTFPGL